MDHLLGQSMCMNQENVYNKYSDLNTQKATSSRLTNKNRKKVNFLYKTTYHGSHKLSSKQLFVKLFANKQPVCTTLPPL